MFDLSMCLLISHTHPCQLREFCKEGFRSCEFTTLSNVMKDLFKKSFPLPLVKVFDIL